MGERLGGERTFRNRVPISPNGEKRENIATVIPLSVSFKYAFRGVFYTFRTQRNFRIEIVCGILAVLSGIYFELESFQWSVLCLSIFGVFCAELLNTAIEFVVDLYEQRYNRLAMLAKDISAGVVLLSALHALAQAGLIFFAPIKDLFLV